MESVSVTDYRNGDTNVYVSPQSNEIIVGDSVMFSVVISNQSSTLNIEKIMSYNEQLKVLSLSSKDIMMNIPVYGVYSLTLYTLGGRTLHKSEQFLYKGINLQKISKFGKGVVIYNVEGVGGKIQGTIQNY